MTHPTDPVAAMREALKFYASMSSWTLTPREGTARTMHLSDAEIDMGKRARDALALPLPAAPADARPMVVGGAFVKFDRPALAAERAQGEKGGDRGR